MYKISKKKLQSHKLIASIGLSQKKETNFNNIRQL